MIDLLAVSLAAAVACTPATDGAPAALPDTSHRSTYESGVSFATFLERAERRKDQWNANYRNTVVPDALAARARAVGGTWKLLVVAADGCSDSVNTIPYIAKLIDTVPGIEMRIVDSDAGKGIMDSHRTPDGRAATPTVIVLDATFEERDCFIERPAALRQWMADHKAKSGDDGLFSGKMEWYDADKGVQTMTEIVAILESAARGGTICG
jgi:hypothetical protein